MEAGRNPGEEATLVDLLQTLLRRRVVFAVVLLLFVGAGIGKVVTSTPSYHAAATVIPIDHPDIISNWLSSRQAAAHVAASADEDLVSRLVPTSDGGGSGARPGENQIVAALVRATTITSATYDAVTTRGDRLIAIETSHPDPSTASDIANAYVSALSALRPVLEDITRDAAFDQYFDGSNREEAERDADATAKSKQYWIVLDHAVEPTNPSTPNTALILAVAVFGGLVAAVVAAFVWEWAGQARARIKAERPKPPRSD